MGRLLPAALSKFNISNKLNCNNDATHKIEEVFRIILMIQTDCLMEAQGRVSILSGSDCKFYRVVSLQLCKVTDEQGARGPLSEYFQGWEYNFPGGLYRTRDSNPQTPARPASRPARVRAAMAAEVPYNRRMAWR
jgi:hypothetical protein